MNMNQYTQKSLEAIQVAQQIAIQNHHQQLEQVHLLLAMLQQTDGLIPQLLQKMGIAPESVIAVANTILRKIPGVSGSREADRFYVSSAVDAALQTAKSQADVMKDEYVSVEHLFLGLLEAADGELKELFGYYSITKENCLKEIGRAHV